MKDIKATASNFDFIIQELRKQDFSKPQRIRVTPWVESRGLSANKVYQSWYPMISDHLAMTIPEATRYIKLTFGLPILFGNTDFGGIIHDGLTRKGFFNVSYERQLVYMDKLPVTRLFTTKMHNKLRDDLQYFFGQQGLDLNYTR